MVREKFHAKSIMLADGCLHISHLQQETKGYHTYSMGKTELTVVTRGLSGSSNFEEIKGELYVLGIDVMPRKILPLFSMKMI